jgi:two-component system, NarL family, sensor histidine kinase DevS
LRRDEVVVSLAGDRQAIAQLLDAVISASRDLRLREVLRRIVGYACVLVDARSGVLGVGEPGQEPVELIHHGDEVGFPPPEPALGAPLRIQDEVIGHLYVTGKAGEFTDEDREHVTALAAGAAIAVENARMYDRGRQRERWLRASNEITAALLDGGDTGDELRLVTELARNVAGTPVAAIAVAHEDDPSKLVFRVIDGLGEASQAMIGETVDVATTASGIVFSTGEPLLLDQYGDAAANWQDKYNGGAPSLLHEMGAAAIVPLAAGEQTLGVLLLIKMRGEPPFTDADLQLLRNFAGHAALALQHAKARADQRRLAVFEERDRIAGDMQDLVIRRLFDISLGLQGLAPLVDSKVWRRMAALVDELDGTIHEVRRSIFSLQDHVDPPDDESRASLVGALGRIIAHAEEALGFPPLASLDNRADSLVPQRIRPDLLATVREALSNVARHARATTVSVTLCTEIGELTLTVVDNGVGIAESRSRSSGLANLGKRAQRWNGSLTVERIEAGGTRLTWTIPLAG